MSDLLLTDQGFSFGEQEPPVLVHMEALIPAVCEKRCFLAKDSGAGNQGVAHIVIQPQTAGIGDPLRGVDFPVRRGGRQQHGVAVIVHQIGQGVFAPLQSGFLLCGQLFPVDVEHGSEGCGISSAVDGLADPVVTGAQGAVFQCPVQLLGEVVHGAIPADGKADAELLKQGSVLRIAGNGFPLAAVPPLQ